MQIATNAAAAGGGSGLPVGALFLGPSYPLAGCLIADGSTVSQAAYPALFALVGLTPNYVVTTLALSDLTNATLDLSHNRHTVARNYDGKLLFPLYAKSTAFDAAALSRPCVAYTTDGVTATSIYVDNGTLSARPYDIAYGASTWVIRAAGCAYYKGALTSGAWTRVTSGIATCGENSNSSGMLCFGGGVFFTTGNSTGNDARGASSTDGITWTARTAACGAASYTYDCDLIHTGTSFLWMRGRSSTGQAVKVLRSTDGAAWTDVTPGSAGVASGVVTLGALCIDGANIKMWVTTGTKDLQLFNSTDDGVTWTLVGTVLGADFAWTSHSSALPPTIIKVGSYFVLRKGTAALWISSDGLTWKDPSAVGLTGATVIGSINGLLVGMSSDSAAFASQMYSADLFSYDEATLFQLPSIGRVAPSGTIYGGQVPTWRVAHHIVAE